MDKKPLIIVSIYAVVLLILGSLSHVVGYQSVKSSVNNSPLFQTRIQRATNQRQDRLTSRFLGIEKGNLLQFPFKGNWTEHLKKAIDIIRKMDDKSCKQFTKVLMQQARQNDTVRDFSYHQILQSLRLIKTNPDAIKNFYTKGNNPIRQTYGAQYTMCGAWFPGCWILSIMSLIMILILFISLG